MSHWVSDFTQANCGLEDYQTIYLFYSVLNDFGNLFTSSDDGFILSNQVSQIVETHLPGFHSYAYDLCYQKNAEPVEAVFPIERLFKSISDLHSLDFDRLWMVLSIAPDLERQQVERMEIFNQTEDPHPSRVFNLQTSTWFRTLMTERIDSDRFNCTYLGSYMFAEVKNNLIFSFFGF